jgi:hypothetical protein
MAVVRHPRQLPVRHGPGWSRPDWASAALFRPDGLDLLVAASTVWTVAGDRCAWEAKPGPAREDSHG